MSFHWLILLAAIAVELLATSAAIPLLAVFWRAVGAVRYRVVFL